MMSTQQFSRALLLCSCLLLHLNMADQPADRRSVQDFVRNVLSAVTNLQTQSNQGVTSEESNRAEFTSISDEINARFQIPRQARGRGRGRATATATATTSTIVPAAAFNPRQNYSSPMQRPSRLPRGGARNRASNSRVDQPDFIYKDICLLPEPDWGDVPRGAAKAHLVERGLYIDAFQLDKNWGEARLYFELASLFKEALRSSSLADIGFEFVKSSGCNIVPVQVPRGQEKNARVMKHISGQGPLYIRSMERLSYGKDGDSDGDEGVVDDRRPSDVSSPPETGSQAEPDVHVGADTRMPDVNSRQPPVSRAQTPPFEQPATGLNNPLGMSITDCIDQLALMFPNMTKVSLERTLQAWQNDMQKAVTAILGAQEGCLQDAHDNIPLSVCRPSADAAISIKEFRESMIDDSAPSQVIRASHSSSSVVRDMFRLLKCGHFNLKATPNVIFDNEAGIDADGITRELCHMVMANMGDGKGGILLFEGQMDHLVPVHSEEYLASQYFKYAGQLIAHSVMHAGFGLTGLSRAITQYLVTEDLNSCLSYLSESDIPDLDIRETLKQIRDAETEDQLNEVTSKDETMVLLTQSGFTNEFVSLSNRHRACQCIMIHAVFKIRREELEQLREGLESISLITFLKLSPACAKYVFPSQSEVEVSKEDFLNLIDKHWIESLSGTQRTTMDWFLQYVNEVNAGDTGNAVSELEQQFSSLPKMAELVQFISGHPYLPSTELQISFSPSAVFPDADSCFFSLRLPTIYSSYNEFKNKMNTAITCQHRGYGRG